MYRVPRGPKGMPCWHSERGRCSPWEHSSYKTGRVNVRRDFHRHRGLRDLAIADFGCTDFISATEGEQEIAISYWPDEASIKNWKQQAEHKVAQQFGREGWYKHYQVEVVKILRSYSGN